MAWNSIPEFYLDGDQPRVGEQRLRSIFSTIKTPRLDYAPHPLFFLVYSLQLSTEAGPSPSFTSTILRASL
jgi:hypothetical protein